MSVFTTALQVAITVSVAVAVFFGALGLEMAIAIKHANKTSKLTAAVAAMPGFRRRMSRVRQLSASSLSLGFAGDHSAGNGKGTGMTVLFQRGADGSGSDSEAARTSDRQRRQRQSSAPNALPAAGVGAAGGAPARGNKRLAQADGKASPTTVVAGVEFGGFFTSASALDVVRVTDNPLLVKRSAESTGSRSGSGSGSGNGSGNGSGTAGSKTSAGSPSPSPPTRNRPTVRPPPAPVSVADSNSATDLGLYFKRGKKSHGAKSGGSS